MKKGIILYVMAVVSNLGMLAVLNRKGEVNTTPPATPPGEATFTQEQVNNMMADHKRGLQTEIESSQNTITDMQAKLKTFETEAETRNQSKLEEGKEYEKLKEGWVSKEGEYKGIIDTQKSNIRDMNISNALTNEIIKQNAHSDVVQLVKSLAQIDDNGVVRLKGKNASGVEDLLSVEEGLKSFLKERPYLVKANSTGGGGTPPAGSGGGNTGSTDPMADARELQAAMARNDRVKVTEIKARIAAKNAQKPAF